MRMSAHPTIEALRRLLAVTSLVKSDIKPSRAAVRRRTGSTLEHARHELRQRALRLAEHAQLIADEARRLAEQADQLSTDDN
jgi:hypothetical protein